MTNLLAKKSLILPDVQVSFMSFVLQVKILKIFWENDGKNVKERRIYTCILCDRWDACEWGYLQSFKIKLEILRIIIHT